MIYNTRPTRFYLLFPTLMSMANPKSGGVKHANIVEVYLYD